jgi:hypothetical protein
MGYRSEAAIALTDDATRLLKAIEEHCDFNGLLGDAEGDYPKHLNPEADNCCKLYWGDIKWYDGYPGIDALTQFMDALPDEDYLFLRSGEELEDNESCGAFHDSDMWITKSLQW